MSTARPASEPDRTSLPLAVQRVGIFGLGLMGASLALALRGKCAALFGIDPDPAARKLAKQRNMVDAVSADPAELAPQADLLILAAPVRAIISLIYDLPAIHPGDAVVLDLGSTKAAIAEVMLSLPGRLAPVGGHPMCGKEQSSAVYAEAGLFNGAAFALTALPNSTPPACRLAEELALAVGARPVWIDPAEHDRLVAGTSHLPYLVANALASVTPLEAAALLGPGFRSTARLASASRRMMLDILITNQPNILSSLSDLRKCLEEIESALAAGDYAALEALLGRGAGRYEELIDQTSGS